MLPSAQSYSAPANEVDIDRAGRRIQLDGFLMDWNEGARRPWPGSNEWFWDAINTPEGVAGYFYGAAPRCSSCTFYIDARRLTGEPRKMSSKVRGKTGGFYAVNQARGDSSSALTVEWIIPWDSVAVDSAGTYVINLAGTSACGDTLQPLLITGSMKSQKREGPLPPHFASRLLQFALLLGVFIWLQFRVRKTNHHRGSLRRSA